MNFIYILLAIIAVLYFVGCVMAYQTAQADNAFRAPDAKLGRAAIVRLSLGSWKTVAASAMEELGSIE